MTRHYIKFIVRNFFRQKPYSFLNLIGLSIGLCVAFLALLHIMQETGYDMFNKNYATIYRIVSVNNIGAQNKSATTPKSIGKTLQEHIPQIVGATSFQKQAIKEINEGFEKEGVYNVSPDIVNVFSFDKLSGNFEDFKEKPYTVILSQKMALKYFNTIHCVGETLQIGKETYAVSAVFKNVPKKSSHKFHVVIREMRPGNGFFESGYSSTHSNYVVLDKNADPEKVSKAIKVTLKELYPQYELNYALQPLSEIHLYSSDTEDRIEGKSSIKKVVIYATIGALILLIAFLNFLFLYNAITQKRFKEFAIRKVNGLGSFGFMKAFFFESLCTTVSASAIALFAMEFAIPAFNGLTDSSLTFNYPDDSVFVLCALLISFGLALISSVYFYYYFIKYSPINLFKNVPSKKGAQLKFSALFFQLAIIVFMLVFSFGYYKQLDFMLHTDKGFSVNNTLVLNRFSVKSKIYIEAAKKYPSIRDVAIGESPVKRNGESIYRISLNDKPSETYSFEAFRVGYNYIPLYHMELKLGRNFSKEFSTDKDAIIINETGAKHLNLENPIGKKTSLGTIIGVVKDFHFDSFHNPIKPLLFKLTEEEFNTVVIKYTNKKKAAQAIKTIINENLEGSPFASNYIPDKLSLAFYGDLESMRNHFLDLDYVSTAQENVYGKEKTLQKSILLLTIVAILITLLGLVGVSLFKTQQKTKEIGIRKVNGATITEIMLMLNKDFIKWVAIAFVIACPIAYYAMQKWLENFAYKTALSWWVFALAGVFTLVIALLTVSWQTYRAATRNPVESLRDE